ncbi:MAG TPA: sigma 54-interacting transcriptional regulator [Kofleriaceae bacterium]|jgi:two-component system response regulator HydG
MACFLGIANEPGIVEAQAKIERRARNLLKGLLDSCAEVACRALRVTGALDAIVGNTDVMRDVRKTCWAAAFGERLDTVSSMSRLFQTTPVLIEGATGTGKELVARALCLSMRGRWKRGHGWTAAPTESVHLASLPAALVESAIFGHERGAYSGAHKERPGVLERCHGGVVFLDEVAELPMSTQVSLLRTLQEGKTRRLGADADRDAAPRIVSATHKDLEELVAENRFRLDLLYRLSSVSIAVPPLVERLADIPLLVEKESELAEPAARPALRDKFDRFMKLHPNYSWPGNVRELHAVVRTLALGLQPRLKQIASRPEQRLTVPSGLADTAWTLREAQRWYCGRALEKAGTQERAAKLLDINRGTLRNHLEQDRDD